MLAAPLLLYIVACMSPPILRADGQLALNTQTPEERIWLVDHPVIKLAPERSYAPFSFEDAAGRLQGISFDFIHLLEQKLGIRFQVLESNNLATILQKVREGEVDIVTSLMQTPERSEYLLFTKPYVTIPTVVIVRSGLESQFSLDRMKNARVAVGRGYAVQSYLQKNYSHIQLVLVDDDTAGLSMLSFGELDAVVADLASASYFVDASKITNLRVAGPVNFNYELSFGSRKDWPIFNAILEKGIAAISREERKAIYDRWVTLNYQSFPTKAAWIGVTLLLGAMAFIVAGAAIWNRTLKRKIQEQTQELSEELANRRRAFGELEKANRAFRTLSEFNQTMVRQTDEMELLQQVCRIVVDVGGYRLVWVGFAENDENKSVLPVASAGYDEGYLDLAKLTWADNERGQGPCGISIRTGKIAVSQNAESNPAFAPWRFEAAKRGIASSISLPLIVEGHVIGALGIYASEPDAFDEEESSLLSNLAENLAYGIGSIRIAEQRKRSEEELRVYTSRLEIINKELQDFAFVAAHDLQEPLRKIQTFCDMAQKRCALVLDGTSKDYLDRIVNSASRMRLLLRDLLEFSRVAARLEPFKKIDFVTIVREAADVFEASVKKTGCQIEIENIPAIEADETQMLRLFQNLIGNALKFRGVETPHIKVYGKLDRQGICEIFVKDNGIGFAPQFAELIFKPFQRLHSRSEYDGTGMGLAICRKIVERHGGSIRAESEPGKGSTFIIRLPVRQDRLETFIARQQL